MLELTRDRRMSTVRRVAAAILPGVPVLFLVALIARYAVNVPFADEFALAPLLVKAHQHAITFSDLFAQHNEHRYFFPGLLFIAFSFLGHGDLRVEMFFSVFLMLLASANLSLILRKTTSLTIGQRSLFLFLFNLLLFSPVQAENWVWGYQLPIFFCGFLLTCGVAVAASTLKLEKKFILCAAIAFIATFSFGGGVALWGLIFPCVLLMEREKTVRARWGWFALWCGLAAGSMALYFFHYVKPPEHPPIAAAKSPAAYFRYITGFLGAHLSSASSLESIVQPVLVGTVLLTLFFGSIVYAVFRRHDPGVANRMLPWFGLGGYALLSALLTAVTRIGFGVNQALDSRYTSFSLYLSIAVIALFIIVKQDLQRRSVNPRVERALLRGETILLTGFAILSVLAYSWGRGFMVISERTRLLGKGALLFTNVIQSDESQYGYLVVNGPQLTQFANQFDSIGVMYPPLLKSAEIAKLDTRNKPAGFVDELTVAGQSCSVSGWAVLPTLHPAHCVVLSYSQPGRGEVAFRVSDEIYGRPDVAKAVDASSATWSGWKCHFDRSALPPGNHLVNAWAFDANRAILYPLGTPKVLQ